jgi:hypothetical protein
MHHLSELGKSVQQAPAKSTSRASNFKVKARSHLMARLAAAQ